MNQAVIVLVVANVLASMKGFSDRLFMEKYKFQVGPILRGEQLRMLTSGFIHVDYTHLLFNMLTLYFFADSVIAHVGTLKFFAIYFGSLLAGSTLALSFHKKEPYYSAVGASGAVMGIVYAGIMLNPAMRIYGLPAIVFGVGYLLYSMYGMKNRTDNIGHSAHLGGAIGGFVLTLALYPQIFKHNRNTILLLAVPIILMFVFKDKLQGKS